MTDSGRPDGSTLRLFREVVDDIAANPAIAAGGPLFTMTMTLIPADNATRVGHWFKEPPTKVRRDLRNLRGR